MCRWSLIWWLGIFIRLMSFHLKEHNKNMLCKIKHLLWSKYCRVQQQQKLRMTTLFLFWTMTWKKKKKNESHRIAKQMQIKLVNNLSEMNSLQDNCSTKLQRSVKFSTMLTFEPPNKSQQYSMSSCNQLKMFQLFRTLTHAQETTVSNNY